MPTINPSQKKHTTEGRGTDLELGRDHLTGYSGWPPPAHILAHLEVFTNYIEKNIVNGKILDLGCGDGAIDRLLAERSPNKIITAVDLEAHKQWEFNHPKNLHFETASIFELPYKDDSFEAIIIKDVLHHLPHPENIIPELTRIAKKQVLIIEANRYNPISYVRMVKIAKHEHLSRRRLKKIIGHPARMHSVEAHVWPTALNKPGGVIDKTFNAVPLLSRIRNYNFVLLEP